jgi:hypothetical protein
MTRRGPGAVLLAGCSLVLVVLDVSTPVDCRSAATHEALMVAAALTAGAAAFLAGRGRRWPWVLGVAGAVIVLAGLAVVELLRWVGACTS